MTGQKDAKENGQNLGYDSCPYLNIFDQES
jgi:hypothetical protein